MHFLVTVAVLVYAPSQVAPGTAAPLDQVRRGIEAAERARGASVVAAPLETAARMHEAGFCDAAALAFFGRGAQLVAAGRAALVRVELAEAERAFAAAEAVYADELWRPGAAAEAAVAALWHGVARFELGRPEEAARAWRRALALEPAAQLTEAVVRPDVARAFAAARAAAATARLTVAAPAGARVRVDGADAGQGAVALAVGEHLVAVDAPGMRPWAALVDVPAAGARLEPPLVPDATGAALQALGARPSADGIEALRRTLGVDEVVVATAARDGGVLTEAAQRWRDGCAGATVTATAPARLVRALEGAGCGTEAPGALFDAAPIAHPRPAPPAETARPRRPGVWTRPWFWMTLVGSAAVGVVVAVSVWPRDPSYTGTLDFHQFSLGGGR